MCFPFQTEKAKTPHFALVANKIDLEHARTVKSDRHHRFRVAIIKQKR